MYKHMKTAASHSSMSPCMSPPSRWEQQGWELLSGTAERVTQYVLGTKASHCANKGKTCCMAISLACLRLLPLGNLTPRTSKQWQSVAFLQSHTACQFQQPLPTSRASSPQHTFGLAYMGQQPFHWRCCFGHPHIHHLQPGQPPPCKAVDLHKSMHSISFVSFPRLSTWWLIGQRFLRPPKKGSVSPSSAIVALPCRHLSIIASGDSRASSCRETLCRGRTSDCARSAKCHATTTPCPFPHCYKGGRLECTAMHMLRTCVSTRSCTLLVNLLCNDMACCTAA